MLRKSLQWSLGNRRGFLEEFLLIYIVITVPLVSLWLYISPCLNTIPGINVVNALITWCCHCLWSRFEQTDIGKAILHSSDHKVKQKQIVYIYIVMVHMGLMRETLTIMQLVIAALDRIWGILIVIWSDKKGLIARQILTIISRFAIL